MENTMENLCGYPPLDPDQTHPWLMVSHGENLRNHTFYSISKNQYFERSIPAFCNKQVSQTTFSGWLALFDFNIQSIDCCLFNTISQEKIQLPPIELEPEPKFYKCILSKPPTDPDCHVLLVSNYILFCRLGDDKFIKRTNKFGDDSLVAAINFQGKVYGWIHGMYTFSLVEVDFVGEQLILRKFGQSHQITWRSLRSRSISDSSRCHDYLVESCGELLMVHEIAYSWRSKETLDCFRIFKVNFLEMKIEELSWIGDRTIFLCPHGSMSTLCGEGTYKKNSIYYLKSDRNLLYVYDIDDRSQTLLKPGHIGRDGLFLMSWVMI